MKRVLHIGTWEIAIGRRSPEIVIVEQPPLKDHVVNEVLGGLEESGLVWRTLMLIISGQQKAALDAAATYVDKPEMSAAYLGGWKTLAGLRQELHDRRKIGRQEMARRSRRAA